MIAALGAVGGVAAAVRAESDAARSAVAAAGGVAAGVLALSVPPSVGARGATLVSTGAALVAACARCSSRARATDARRRAITLPQAAEPASPLPEGATFDVPGLSPLFTPPEHFYVTDVALPAPSVDHRAWRLRVTGMVDRPLELSLEDLLGMTLSELDATLVCVHNPVGGSRIGSARWLGLPLADLLERAGVQPDAEQLVARSVDGFTAGIPVSRVSSPHAALLAIGMNGEPLTVANGFPARLLVPGLWGADANTKWVTELELTTWGAVRDYWDRRGWPRQPSAVRPGARIDTPRHRDVVPVGTVTVAGMTWAPPRGVDGVEVSVDDGPWRQAELSAPVAPTLWRQWRLEWAAAAGRHVIRVRALSDGRPQTHEPAPPYPVGSAGHHTITLEALPEIAARRSAISTRGGRARDDLHARLRLAAAAVPAWRSRGFPPAPRWPAPR